MSSISSVTTVLYKLEGIVSNGLGIFPEYIIYKFRHVLVIATYSAFLSLFTIQSLIIGRNTVSNCKPFALWYVMTLGFVVVKFRESTLLCQSSLSLNFRSTFKPSSLSLLLTDLTWSFSGNKMPTSVKEFVLIH